jgi:hypothetical protein
MGCIKKQIALQAETKRSMKMVSDNLGPIIAGDGRRFLDTPLMSATRARCIYFGKLMRERPKWQRDNPDNIRLLTVAEQTALAPRTEGTVEAALPPVSVPTLLSDKRPDGAAVRPFEDEQSAPVMLPAVATPQAQSTGDELIVEGRHLVSQQRVAEILAGSVRTLQRWNKRNIGPPLTKVGRRNFYDLEQLTNWLRAQ